jgi:hypothetical protein
MDVENIDALEPAELEAVLERALDPRVPVELLYAVLERLGRLDQEAAALTAAPAAPTAPPASAPRAEAATPPAPAPAEPPVPAARVPAQADAPWTPSAAVQPPAERGRDESEA